MNALLRYSAVALLAVWLGGVVFYGTVVVPTAHEVLGSHREIGFVTRRVTGIANLLGAGTLAVLFLNLVVSWSTRSPPRGRWLVGSTFAIMLLAQATLFLMRARLDVMLDPEAMRVLDRDRFLWLHERYLNVTTVLCLAGAVHLWSILTPAPETAAKGLTAPRP